MKPKVDKDTCIACGLCPSICPECFDMQDDGKAGAIVDEVPDDAIDSAREAEESCPVNAIEVEE
jgi:ferredoxin